MQAGNGEGGEVVRGRWAIVEGNVLGCFKSIPCNQHSAFSVTQIFVVMQTYIILWSYPCFYAHTIEGITSDTTINSRSRRWRSFAGGVRKLCYTALTKGALCLGSGAYIVQNSWETVPSMLGIILLVAGIFVLLDMFVLLPYIDAIVAREELYCSADGPFIEQTAMILSVPVASLIWSLIVLTASIISYFGQSGAPQLDLEPGPDMMLSTRVFGDHSQSSSHDRDHDSLQASSFIAAHNFPVLAKLGVGLMVTFCAVQFIALLCSVTRQRSVANVASDLEAAASTPNSDDASASAVSLQDLSTS